MTALEILTAARAKVAQGWVQGAYARGGCYCVSGAITEAVTGSPDLWPKSWADRASPWCVARELLSRAIGANSVDDIVSFNDAPGRTQAEVVAAFDKAIEMARGGR